MENALIPYSFIPGTKAKAQEVNANFISLADNIQQTKDDVNIKLEEINEKLIYDTGKITEKLDETIEAKAEKDLSNVEVTASKTVKGITQFAESAETVEETRPAAVVESFKDDTSWYRVYSDGFIEQGGIHDIGKRVATFYHQFNFVKPYSTSMVSAFIATAADTNSVFGSNATVGVVDATGFYIGTDRVASSHSYRFIQWRAYGY